MPLTFCQLPSTGVMLLGNGGKTDSASVCLGSCTSRSITGKDALPPNRRAPTVSSREDAPSFIDM